jgi:hypothetical protein
LLATPGFVVQSKSTEYYKRGSKGGRLSAGAELRSDRSLFILGRLKNIFIYSYISFCAYFVLRDEVAKINVVVWTTYRTSWPRIGSRFSCAKVREMLLHAQGRSALGICEATTGLTDL